jgi:hypothetical protein
MSHGKGKGMNFLVDVDLPLVISHILWDDLTVSEEKSWNLFESTLDKYYMESELATTTEASPLKDQLKGNNFELVDNTSIFHETNNLRAEEFIIENDMLKK